MKTDKSQLAMQCSIILQPEREKSLLRRHPWIFSRAIATIKGNPKSGQTVDVYSSKGQWLAKGSYSPSSQIRVRIWTFNPHQAIDIAFFKGRLQHAQAARDPLIKRLDLNAYRLIAAESDGLPGITIDRYDNYLVCQLLSAGAEFQRKALIKALRACYPDCHIYERSDVAVRSKEGLEPTQGVLHGDEPPAQLVIEENNGVKIAIDIRGGHKTGFYLDQRDNRQIAARYCDNKRVLNCFCYTGAFGVYALRGGAQEVVNVDVSKDALDLAQHNVDINGLDLNRAKFVQQDVFALLREYDKQGEKFDVIVLDPPKFAENKQQLDGACRGYKDINRLALKLLNPGGVLLTYSCSGLMNSDLFQKIVADAALDAQVEAQIIERLSQAADHPIATNYPEGFYLKGLVVLVH